MHTIITLRPIEKQDLEWARQLRNANKTYFFDSREITRTAHAQWFASRTEPFFVIEYNGVPAGTIALRKIREGYEIQNVLIDEVYRRKGVLKQVMKTIEQQCIPPYFVDVLATNKDAIQAYSRLGFSLFSLRLRKE